MKSCENCYWSYRDEDNRTVCANTEDCFNFWFWKFDYKTLESENTNLNQELEARERMIEERNRIIRSQVDWVDEARKERDELKRELEVRDRELELLSEHNESCPSDYGLITCDLSLPERCDVDNSECWLKWALEKARKDLSRD